MNVNRDAPAVARSEAQIAADPETVWAVLTGFDSWPSWNPDVKSVQHDGAVEEGSVFRWKAGRATLTSTIRRVDRPRLIGWTGKTTGIEAVHVWRLELRNDGTHVQTEESWEGLLVRTLRGPLRRSLQKSLDDGLTHLQAEAERRAHSPG
jgi:uncharacterized protein YndB with AHSA1/START domain